MLTAPAGELHAVEWARLATTPGLRLIFEAPDDEHRGMQRTNLRIGGFKEKVRGAGKEEWGCMRDGVLIDYVVPKQ